ncbi:SubName: Full=Uncharacterized protein {ECO:0000313/EMBL:CCA70188.1} [Serendipita indica DSM 11827]|nr:SubName: Full=Uncharacterized protein {ECO:0000313/EMBL:CCA70188.1} [Serendipita indica DSM 11827]
MGVSNSEPPTIFGAYVDHQTATFASKPAQPTTANDRPAIVYYHVQSPPEPPSRNPHLFKKMMDKALGTWTEFGKAEKTSWKFKLYAWGERVADRIEFEENALKAINTSFRPDAPKPEFNLGSKDDKALFIYPKGLSFEVFEDWKSHVRLREPYHKRYFYLWSLGLPVTAPIGIAPIIPNVPFYFCAWRAWCHWKAWRATIYLNQLLTIDYFEPTADAALDTIYSPKNVSQSNLSLSDSVSASSHSSGAPSSASSDSLSDSTPSPSDPASKHAEFDPMVDSQLVLREEDVPGLVTRLELPQQVGSELLRAIEQTRVRLRKELAQDQKQQT